MDTRSPLAPHQQPLTLAASCDATELFVCADFRSRIDACNWQDANALPLAISRVFCENEDVAAFALDIHDRDGVDHRLFMAFVARGELLGAFGQGGDSGKADPLLLPVRGDDLSWLARAIPNHEPNATHATRRFDATLTLYVARQHCRSYAYARTCHARLVIQGSHVSIVEPEPWES